MYITYIKCIIILLTSSQQFNKFTLIPNPVKKNYQIKQHRLCWFSKKTTQNICLHYHTHGLPNI